MQLIKLNPDHYVVVDGQPTGVTYYLDDTNAVRKAVISDPEYWAVRPEYRKITHSTQPIEQYYGASDGSVPYVYHKIQPLLLSEVKELLGEVDVEKKAEIIAKSLHNKSKHDDWSIYEQLIHEDKELIKLGYNQALEDNKEKKYTEEDLKKAIKLAQVVERDHEDSDGYLLYSKDEIIQSLKPQTEWKVEFVGGKLKLK